MRNVFLRNSGCGLFESLSSVEFFLSVLYVVLVLGLTVPYGFPITFPLVFLYFMLFFVKWCCDDSVVFRINFGFILFYLCILSYFSGMALNQGVVYYANKMDLKNIVTLLILPFMIGALDVASFRRFVRIYHYLVIPLVCLIGIFSLTRLYLATAGGGKYYSGIFDFGRVYGSALDSNHNMYCLGMFFGLYAAWASFCESKGFLIRVLCLLTVAVSVVSIGLSGSRRGWLVLSVVVLYAVARELKACVTSFIKYPKFFNIKLKMIGSFFGILTIAVFICWGVLSYKDKFMIEDFRKLEKLETRYKSLFSKEGSFSEAFSERSEKWMFAAELMEEYSILENLFGSGFGYLDSYGQRFNSKRSQGDPHNFLISAMLYSGMIGVVLMLSLIIFTFYKLWINKEIYRSEFIFVYLTTLAFLSVGGNSLYSVKILPVVIVTILSVKNVRNDDMDVRLAIDRK